MNYAGSRIVTFGGRAMDSGNDEKLLVVMCRFVVVKKNKTNLEGEK
jgi:hypothetical protein